jgi:hypothetical protein
MRHCRHRSDNRCRYYHGLGCPRDPAAAAVMYRSAADSKNVEAMVKDIRFVFAVLCVCFIVCVRLRFFCDPLRSIYLYF